MLRFEEGPHPSTPVASSPTWSPTSWSPATRAKRWAVTPRRIAVGVGLLLSFLLLNQLVFSFSNHAVCAFYLYPCPEFTDQYCSTADQVTLQSQSPTMQPLFPTPPSNPLRLFPTVTPTPSTHSPAISTAIHATSPPSICTHHSHLFVPTANPC